MPLIPKYLKFTDALLIYAVFFKENFSDDADLSGFQKLALSDPILYKRIGINNSISDLFCYLKW